MTVWFSDHFGTDGVDDITIADPVKVISAGIGHSRLRYKRAELSSLALLATPDVLRFFTLKSGDRLHQLMLSSDGGSGVGAADFGLHLKGTSAHDGAALDADLFATAQAINSALNQVSIFSEATTLLGADRGKTLWALAAIGGGSDTVDPMLEYDFTATVTTAFTTTNTILVLEALYTSGD